MKKRLKINGIIIFCAFVLVAAFPAFFLRKEQGLVLYDQIAEMVGIAFILLGQLFRVSARGYKAELSKNGHALLKTGPYSLVRNPMYLGIFFIGLGIVLMLFEWWTIIVFVTFFAFRYIVLIFNEEKKLRKAFPEEYPDYERRVPRIVPRIESIVARDIREYLPLRLKWLNKEIGAILLVLFLALLVESWEDVRRKGLGIYWREISLYLVVIVFFILIVMYLNRRTNGLHINDNR